MPQLTKTGRLLRTVRGKPHATTDHHEPEQFEQDDQKEVLAGKDISWSPKGISDEEELRVHDSGISIGVASQTDAFKPSADMDTGFGAAFSAEEPARSAKRKLSENIHVSSDEEMDQWSKKRKKGATYFGRGNPSTFKVRATVQPTRKVSSKFRLPNAFHKEAEQSSQSSQESKPTPTFRRPPQTIGTRPNSVKDLPEAPKFKPPSLAFGKSSINRSLPTFIQRPILVKHEDTAEDDLSSPSSPQSWIADDGDDDFAVLNDGSTRYSQPRCPICGNTVMQEALDDFELQYPNMDLRAQQLFCRTHKNVEALHEWSERDYPDIDWHRFPQRLETFRQEISDLLKEPETSHFRSEMEHRLRRGKDRTLAMHVDNEDFQSCSVGYYGPRGLRLMTHFILNQFADEIRRLAGSDTVIAARGPTGYVQMVLAPELATLLVKEDMREVRGGMNDEEARKILSASFDLGELLNGIEESTQQSDFWESQPVIVEGGLEDF